MFIFLLNITHSQSTNNVINVASGNSVLKSTDFHSFSIGETIISKIASPKTILTQGFLQPIGPYYLFTNRDATPCYTWKVWPVSANTVLNVSIDHTACFSIEKTMIRILKENGDIVLSCVGLEGTNVFACNTWVPSTYIIELISDGKVQSTKKVVVIH